MQYHYKNTAEIKPAISTHFEMRLSAFERMISVDSYPLVGYNCIDWGVSLENISS